MARINTQCTKLYGPAAGGSGLVQSVKRVKLNKSFGIYPGALAGSIPVNDYVRNCC